ncbi:hypothetical protein BDN71DRAFT_584713 [Pleurotus eryngii]|uniref:Uncharacterized protein n=1 Tax=Pleurotus eryngii TaxID=5323 RepID=A0A9P6A1D2_PLEER|nr:hypothetical protein BDN71DRAFT_584713 [Pleurotus eryngii]
MFMPGVSVLVVTTTGLASKFRSDNNGRRGLNYLNFRIPNVPGPKEITVFENSYLRRNGTSPPFNLKVQNINALLPSPPVTLPIFSHSFRTTFELNVVQHCIVLGGPASMDQRNLRSELHGRQGTEALKH